MVSYRKQQEQESLVTGKTLRRGQVGATKREAPTQCTGAWMWRRTSQASREWLISLPHPRRTLRLLTLNYRKHELHRKGFTIHFLGRLRENSTHPKLHIYINDKQAENTLHTRVQECFNNLFSMTLCPRFCLTRPPRPSALWLVLEAHTWWCFFFLNQWRFVQHPEFKAQSPVWTHGYCVSWGLAGHRRVRWLPWAVGWISLGKPVPERNGNTSFASGVSKDTDRWELHPFKGFILWIFSSKM